MSGTVCHAGEGKSGQYWQKEGTVVNASPFPGPGHQTSPPTETKRHLNFVNASYLFTHISYLDKTYTTAAQEPSMYVHYSQADGGPGQHYQGADEGWRPSHGENGGVGTKKLI